MERFIRPDIVGDFLRSDDLPLTANVSQSERVEIAGYIRRLENIARGAGFDVIPDQQSLDLARRSAMENGPHREPLHIAEARENAERRAAGDRTYL